jgi:hypothetical protein
LPIPLKEGIEVKWGPKTGWRQGDFTAKEVKPGNHPH